MRNCFWQLLIWILLFPLFGVAQPTTNYWFEGYVYGSATDNASQRGQFVPVVLAQANAPTKYLAISMTDGAGFFSFRGTPIDYKQQYIVTLLYGTKNESYKCLRYDTPPALIGAISSDVKTKIRSDFYTSTNLSLAKQKAGTSFASFLKKQPTLQLKAGVYYIKGKKGVPNIYVNGKRYYSNDFQNLVSELTTDQVESVRVLKLKSPNKFIPGAIEIKLKEGDWVSLNAEHNFVPLPKK